MANKIRHLWVAFRGLKKEKECHYAVEDDITSAVILVHCHLYLVPYIQFAGSCGPTDNREGLCAIPIESDCVHASRRV